MSVGEVFLAAFVGILFAKLSAPELWKFIYKKSFQKELVKWRRTLQMLQAVLNEAEEKQLTDQTVRLWLHDLRDLAYDVEDILDEFATEALQPKLMAGDQASTSKVQQLVTANFTRLNPSCVKFHGRMRCKIRGITCRLNDTCDQAAKLGLQRSPQGPSTNLWRRTQSTCLPNGAGFFGRDEDKKKILELVLQKATRHDANFDVVPIVGMGGAGKTTLAQVVYNHKAAYHFSPKVWVCVSTEFDVMRISKAILEAVTYKPCELKEFNQVQVKLRETLSAKRFLLVLDDVWNKNYGLWEALKSPFAAGAPGSKIIVTTRCIDVALTIGTVAYHKLELLLEDDIWSVFVKHALKDGDAGENLGLVRKKVVQKCCGLPLAARTLGGLLRSKPRDEWEKILDRKLWNLPDESDILPVLRLSYHHLPPHLKRCFVYCAVIPKGYEFEEEELVLLWMAEGLIQPNDDSRQLEELGGEYFRELVSRSIFQVSTNDRSLYVMNDLVNDLARWAAGETYFGSEDELEDHLQPERSRHSSYTRDDYDGIKKFEAFHKTKRLRTFLPFRHGETSYITNNVVGLLPNLKSLRVLSLSGYNISELPNSIGELKLLRYLDLSSTMIRSLPESTGSLYNLQTLILRDCSYLTKWPSKMGNLINLCYLDITDVYLISEMPLGIKNLKRLRKLSDFAVSRKIGHGIEELKDLNSLRGKLCISRLENAVDPRRARQANLQEKQDLETLVLKWSSDITDSRDERIEKDVLGMLQPHQGLKELTINSYSATEFPSWVGDPCFSNMVLLSLENCENCTSLPALGLLKSLKDLAITGMSGLQSIGCDIYGEGCSNPFPSLETLYFKDMPGWKHWHTYDEEQVEVFPRLRKLSILNCSQVLGRLPFYLPSLEELVICDSKCLSVTISSFPMLRYLDVDGCKELICRSTIQFSSLNTVALSCISNFSFLTEGFMQGLAEVKNLKITGCQELTNFWQNGVRLLQHLSSLRYLKIKSCSRLVSLGAEEEGQELKLGLPCSLEMLKLINCESLQRPLVLHGFRSLEELHIEKCAGLVFFVQTTLPCTLKRLCISYCDNLQCLLEEGKDSNISSTSLLEYLDIRNCPSLKCLSSKGKLPSPLRQLVIWDCPELGSVAETFCNLSLEKLEIKYCGKLTCLPEGLNMLSHLQEITICNCSSIVSFPEGGFPATSLKKLYIGWCEKLQALPERLRSLTSLVELDIHTCPSIVSFPQDGFPTNLTSLLITNLNFCKPLFDWGLHRLASLTRLFITAGCAHILSFPCEETGMMLPTSLSSLSIVNFPSLQHLSSNGFQNLTFLQELWISDCPMLKSLPENGLPSSLLELYIHGCPLLKNKCKRDTGKEFSKIAHIPCVYIDERFIYDSEDEE
ncbi:hypothetical protein SADUNF_Sadunf01G0020000 [Salix dunnii]|uniref:Disease resistance RPP13-like protein 1 n=1 Tax=Salix dunnii TaxID=1413687 RepID=A0A835N9J4_9ROSI|nr:hypothetical protein SADUNF_Sadunf01G0020000 [Salix dunnii]